MPLSELIRLPAVPRWAWRMAAPIGLAVAVAVAVRAALPFVPDSQPTGWVNRPALTSYNLSSGNEVLYRADYRVGTWAGGLHANLINEQGEPSLSSPWTSPNAAVLLDAVSWDTGRRIVTRNATGTNVAFRWSALSLSQQTQLGSSTTGPRLLQYLRGERSNEYPQGTLRSRTTVLGDIQHSTLLHWNHGGGKKRLYVGANDGMLHAFDAANGAEVFAYVPSMLVPRLPRLAARPYTPSLYVDGALSISDVAVGTVTKTWLAGTLGGGGKGLFMLDISDPDAADEAAAAAKIKWELSPASSGLGNLGYTYAAPRITRLQHGVAAVVVGNGYNNAGNGHASLLVIDADSGTLIREIGTGVGSSASPNGLSTATLLDSNGDGRIDRAYAGDLDGNLWRFDLGSTNPADYSVTKLMTTSPAQAITTAPSLVPHPAGGHLVVFGTGRMLSAADTTDSATHAVHGLWDGAPAANTGWLLQTLGDTSHGGQPLRFASGNLPNWAAGGHRGWSLALPAGERLVGEAPFIDADRFYFVASNPTVPAAAAGKPAGMTWLYELDFVTGGTPARSVYDINGDDIIDDGDKVGGKIIAGRQLGVGIYSQPVLVDLAAHSLTLFNWQSGLSDALPTEPLPNDPGVSGGHFDVDFYHRASGTFMNVKHVHEYDDKYDVTGVNFLNASNPAFNLAYALTSTSTPFKVLVVNQYLNPAVKLSVGNGDFTVVKEFGGQASAASATALVAALPTYTRATVGSLAFKLPLDAFKAKDWWGDGSVRAGLIPTQTSCVNKVNADGSGGQAGLYGERHDGALTLQIIKSTTPASALELNYTAGGAKYGWRVKAAEFSNYVLAEYTAFWHHSNGKCYGLSGWVPDPPQDTGGSSKALSRAANSDDPDDGNFVFSVPSNVTVVSTSTTVSGATTTTVTRYSDDKTSSVSVRINEDGTETVTTTNREGQVLTTVRSVGSTVARGAEEVLAGTRRLSWREIVRQ